MIHIDSLCVGSTWMKSLSKKRYTVVGFAIDSSTSLALVVYKKDEEEDWYTRTISEWLGDVLVPGSDPKKYVPRFVPYDACGV